MSEIKLPKAETGGKHRGASLRLSALKAPVRRRRRLRPGDAPIGDVIGYVVAFENPADHDKDQFPIRGCPVRVFRALGAVAAMAGQNLSDTIAAGLTAGLPIFEGQPEVPVIELGRQTTYACDPDRVARFDDYAFRLDGNGEGFRNVYCRVERPVREQLRRLAGVLGISASVLAVLCLEAVLVYATNLHADVRRPMDAELTRFRRQLAERAEEAARMQASAIEADASAAFTPTWLAPKAVGRRS